MNNIENKYKPSIALVFGYLLNIDRKPKTARKNGLNDRLSIAFDTYNPDAGETYFDISMFENIFSDLLLEFNFDYIEVILYKNKIQSFTNFSEAINAIKEWEKQENTPCEGIFLYLNRKLVCYVETEFYASVGGPDPYHDTYNFAFFTSNINIENIQKRIMQCCERNDYIVRDIEKGLTEPKRTVWDRIKSLFYINKKTTPNISFAKAGQM